MFGADDLSELRQFRPPRAEPDDFDDFWAQTLAEARAVPVQAVFTSVPTRLQTIETFEVSFRGFGGQPIRGWLNVPRIRTGRLPCVVEYVGYAGGRGGPYDWLSFASAGYAHLIMDNRGQGGSWQSGDTPDVIDRIEPHAPGFMTIGLESPYNYHYRRIYADAVRAVEAARTSPLVDSDHIAVTGSSIAGGVCLAVSGLAPGVQAVMPNVPIMCDIRRTVGLVAPYLEIAVYLRANPAATESVGRTLDYFDAMNFAARATAPALFAVALSDILATPRSVFAAYNHYQGEKDIRVLELHTHRSWIPHHLDEQLAFLAQLPGMTG